MRDMPSDLPLSVVSQLYDLGVLRSGHRSQRCLGNCCFYANHTQIKHTHSNTIVALNKKVTNTTKTSTFWAFLLLLLLLLLLIVRCSMQAPHPPSSSCVAVHKLVTYARSAFRWRESVRSTPLRVLGWWEGPLSYQGGWKTSLVTSRKHLVFMGETRLPDRKSRDSSCA